MVEAEEDLGIARRQQRARRAGAGSFRPSRPAPIRRPALPPAPRVAARRPGAAPVVAGAQPRVSPCAQAGLYERARSGFQPARIVRMRARRDARARGALAQARETLGFNRDRTRPAPPAPA
eukprot:gene5807-22670_t